MHCWDRLNHNFILFAADHEQTKGGGLGSCGGCQLARRPGCRSSYLHLHLATGRLRQRASSCRTSLARILLGHPASASLSRPNLRYFAITTASSNFEWSGLSGQDHTTADKRVTERV